MASRSRRRTSEGRTRRRPARSQAGAADGNIRGGIGVDRLGRADPHRDGGSRRTRAQLGGARRAGAGAAGARRHHRRACPTGSAGWSSAPGSTASRATSRIHSGGMLVTAAPLIDIAPIERATMQDRVVVQFDKRDVEELKLIKLDLLGLGMLAAIDETLQLIEHDCATCVDPRLDPGGDPRGLRRCSRRPTRWASSRSRAGPRCRRCRSRGRARSTTSSSRSRSSGRARSRATRSIRTSGGSRASSR